MNSDGEIRMLAAGEEPRADEIRLSENEYQALRNATRAQRQEAYRQIQPGRKARKRSQFLQTIG